MKVIGLISDTHIPSRRKELPIKVIKTFKDSNVNLIIHAGDFEDLSLIPVIEDIAPLSAVHGNMCHQNVKTRFSSKEIIKVEDLVVGITHGDGSRTGYFERVLDSFSNENPQPNIIISGHTHKPEAVILNGVQMINPGSPTDKIFASRNTIAILEINGTEFKYRFVDIE
ncbi:MAG: metallophosphoesterase family protein [Candidatus Hodarchaeota archaeon]